MNTFSIRPFYPQVDYGSQCIPRLMFLSFLFIVSENYVRDVHLFYNVFHAVSHCSTLPGIVNGRVSSDTVSLGLNITYSCNAGYGLFGAVTAQCLPPCNPTTCSLSVPPPTCMGKFAHIEGFRLCVKGL